MQSTTQDFYRYIKLLLVICWSINLTPLASQNLQHQINPDLLEKTWKARWIYADKATGTGYGVFHFRKAINLNEIPKDFIVHVSADNRYRLYVNGQSVCFGPARGDLLNWRYETVDLAPFLQVGQNVLAAVVWNFGEFRPLAQFTLRTAFILQGNTEKEEMVNTGSSWKVIENKAYKPIPVDNTMVDGYYVAGPGDMVDGKNYPWDWDQPDFNDSSWDQPGVIWNPGVPRGVYNYSGQSGWYLIPRNIPMMEESLLRFSGIERMEGIDAHDGFLKGESTLEVPPHKTITILLNQSHLAIGYPELYVSGGKGSCIKINYAEALQNPDGKKGNRNVTEGKILKGYFDIFYPDGGKNRQFRPLWYRTYRYVKMEIQTEEEPLSIHDYYSIFTAYPFKENASFISGDPMLDQIWSTGWRTVRLCATETYADCPYYEQLQYLGDARIQSLISLYISGDDRLVRNAISLFNASRVPDGLTMSRYPTFIPQFHPTFSLIWILMIYDYLMHRPDKDFTIQFLQGIDNVLNWFDLRISGSGILGKLEWPNYMDAAPGFGPAGSPPNAEQGQSAQISLLYAYALDHAARIYAVHGRKNAAIDYSKRSEAIKENVFRLCYDPNKELFAETPEKKAWTQHTNILAVLTDAIPEHNQKDLISRILKDTDIIPAQIYFKFYLMQAMKKAGLGDLYLDNLQPWQTMIQEGLTTFAERALEGRSDCHAWSAHPCYDFLATVCGIEPLAIGFKSVRIRPHLGRLEEVKGKMPHPAGEIIFEFKRKGETGLSAYVILPEHIDGLFTWNGIEKALQPGEQVIEF